MKGEVRTSVVHQFRNTCQGLPSALVGTDAATMRRPRKPRNAVAGATFSIFLVAR